MKRLIAAAISALILTTSVFATGEVTVNINGNEISEKGTIIDGRTMVPVRGVFEKFGYEVGYDTETKTATLSIEGTEIKMTQGESAFTINNSVITPDVPQQIVNDRFMLPLRAVGEAIGAEVSWDGETKTASLAIAEAKETATEETTEAKQDTIDSFSVPGVTFEILDPFNMEGPVTDIEVN